MKWVLIALALSGTARAEHATGYLPLPKDAPRTFYTPPFQAEDLPERYDARTETACIPPVRNQGSCGSCWAFATTGAFETAYCLATGVLPDLAEQDPLVNDSSAYGCRGGFMSGKFITEKGVTTEALCPYRASDRYSCSGAKYAKATKWALIGSRSRAPTDDELKAAIVTYGSLFVTVASAGLSPDANGRVSGSACRRTGVDHMVQIVGYQPAPDGGVEYVMKNSWGQWGKGGYAYLKKGCTELASSPGDAAGFFYVEDEDQPDPTPVPAKVEGLAEEYTALKGNPVLVQAKPLAGHKYRWSVGGGPVLTGARITVQTTTSTTAVLKVTDPQGGVTEKAVKISVK